MDSIKTFSQRQKAEAIYSKHFDPDSECCIDFNVIYTLKIFGAISEHEAKVLDDILTKSGDGLWNEIRRFDKSVIKNNRYEK